MDRVRRGFKLAPPTIRAAAGLSAAELVMFLAGVIAGALHSAPGSGTAGPPRFPSLLLGTLLFAPLFWLPFGVVLSRYPRRRYREALLFQGILLVAFVLSAVTDHASLSAGLAGVSLVLVWLLRRPSVSAFVAQRERAFAAVRGT